MAESLPEHWPSMGASLDGVVWEDGTVAISMWPAEWNGGDRYVASESQRTAHQDHKVRPFLVKATKINEEEKRKKTV